MTTETHLAAVVPLDGGAAVAWGKRWDVVPDDEVRALARRGVRWVWWGASADLVRAGFRPAACWDLAAVHRLLAGGSRDDPGTVWAQASGLAASAQPRAGQLDLLSPGSGGDPGAGDPGGGDPEDPIQPDGYLRPGWRLSTPARAGRWALLALDAQRRQQEQLAGLPDPRRAPRGPALPLQTAWAESAAAVLAAELAVDGLPVARDAAEALLGGIVGPRPHDEAAAAEARAARDARVFATLPEGTRCDLRNPAQVRELLVRLGFDLPDTRSFRLEPFRGAHPVIAALLEWRRVERIATTYGYGWLDAQVGADGRLRGLWSASDGGAGRMTAGAGLHNLPGELRSIVSADDGWCFVRADLGQIEPRVLAAVSGDAALAAATRADDLYLPVAEELDCDRPTAKVAVLAAMYGQTSGTAGAALRRMQRAYPTALDFLARADAAGRAGHALLTWGGRRIGVPAASQDPRVAAARGRFARNAVVQGAAAEVFKAWAAAVRNAVREVGASIVLCLHDELLLHVPEDSAPSVAEVLDTTLRSTTERWAAGSAVRFVADVSVVRRWSDAKA